VPLEKPVLDQFEIKPLCEALPEIGRNLGAGQLFEETERVLQMLKAGPTIGADFEVGVHFGAKRGVQFTIAVRRE
jgi:hypothetical protein